MSKNNSKTVSEEKNKQEKKQVIGKDEMNLAEFPFSFPSRRSPREIKKIKIEKETKDANNNKIKQSWIVSGNVDYGIPNELGEQIYIALMLLTKKAGFSQKVPFSIYQILKIMKQEDNGRNYNQVKRVLRQLKGITIYTENSFWDNKSKRYLTIEKGFNLIDDYEIKKRNDQESGYFKWSDIIYKSIKENNYIKNLNLDFYFSLENPLAKRLYRFLDKHLYQQSSFEIEAFELSKYLAIPKRQYFSQIEERLNPALDEIKNKGFLQSYEYSKKDKERFLNFTRNDTFSNLLLEKEELEEKEEDKLMTEIKEIAQRVRLKERTILRLKELYGMKRLKEISQLVTDKKDPHLLFVKALKKSYIVT